MLKRADILASLKKETTIIDCHTHVGVSPKMLVHNQYPYCLSFEDLVIRMKYLGIGRSIVFPRGSTFYLRQAGAEGEKYYPAFSRYPFEKENPNLFCEIFEMFPEYSCMAVPFAYFDPSRFISEQVENLEKIERRYPLCGLKTVTAYSNSFIKDLEKIGRPILDFARRHRLPFIIHTSVSPKDPWAAVGDLIALARNNPDLKFCAAHTARFSKEALDQAAALPNCFVDVSAFAIHCQLAVENHIEIAVPAKRFAADYRNPAQVMEKLARHYPETILWGTDTPCYYYISNYIDDSGETVTLKLKLPYDDEIKILKSLDAEIVKNIAWRNTLDFLEF